MLTISLQKMNAMLVFYNTYFTYSTREAHFTFLSSSAGFVLETSPPPQRFTYFNKVLIHNRAYLLHTSIQSSNILFPLAIVLSDLRNWIRYILLKILYFSQCR